MKRITAIILSLVLLVTMAFTASAQESVTITVGSAKGEVGELVQIPVTVSEGHYLVNGRIFLSYDPNVLELQQVCEDEDNPYFEQINEEIIDSSFMWAFASPVVGRANFVFATSSDSGNAAGGTIFTLTFKLLQTTDGTPITATIPEMRCNNGGAEDYDAPLTIENGTVRVVPYDPTPAVKGDANGDGQVNLSDALRVFYYFNGIAQLTDKQIANADLNGDGQVSLAEVTRLFYYVSGQSAL